MDNYSNRFAPNMSSASTDPIVRAMWNRYHEATDKYYLRVSTCTWEAGRGLERFNAWRDAWYEEIRQQAEALLRQRKQDSNVCASFVPTTNAKMSPPPDTEVPLAGLHWPHQPRTG